MFKTIAPSDNVPAGGSAVVGSYEVPSCSRLRLLGIANYTNNQNLWGSGIWRVRRNQVPVAPYDEIKDEAGAGAMAAPAEAVEFFGGDVLDVFCENGLGAVVMMGMRIDFDLS